MERMVRLAKRTATLSKFCLLEFHSPSNVRLNAHITENKRYEGEEKATNCIFNLLRL
ncbi:hypothetical protein RHGRI_021144 [Rhododendron griersonianum]|uniref:Uncharacterized protein n=1 Tax=Rhododendron griersonianum TaxID=479676 RepID=A0AAV6JPE2_9ERIC|nr:hypothetical protein RHGRI_021144 [Rhododendron griersonianum]